MSNRLHVSILRVLSSAHLFNYEILSNFGLTYILYCSLNSMRSLNSSLIHAECFSRAVHLRNRQRKNKRWIFPLKIPGNRSNFYIINYFKSSTNPAIQNKDRFRGGQNAKIPCKNQGKVEIFD